MAALDDWVEDLSAFSQPAIEHACQSYRRDQPRRRPSPGDILARAETWQRDSERRAIGGDLPPHLANVAEWATTTGRMGRSDAIAAIRSDLPVPEWCVGDVAEAVYRVRNSPACMTPDDGGIAKYRKGLNA